MDPKLEQNSSETPGEAIQVPVSKLHDFKLGLKEVHVWHAALDERLVGSMQSLISEDEQARADRFRFAKDRNRFIVARGLLRKILASYLGLPAVELRFSYAEKGKPSLTLPEQGSLNFNLAHSHTRAIYAFTRSREVGIDIEFEREDLADEAVARRFFSGSEVECLFSLVPEHRRRAFFNCWTRKEAYIKALGEGLSMPLDQFDVSLAPGEPARFLKNRSDANEVRRWSLQSLPVEEGYVAALVVEGHDWILKTFSLVCSDY